MLAAYSIHSWVFNTCGINPPISISTVPMTAISRLVILDSINGSRNIIGSVVRLINVSTIWIAESLASGKNFPTSARIGARALLHAIVSDITSRPAAITFLFFPFSIFSSSPLDFYLFHIYFLSSPLRYARTSWAIISPDQLSTSVVSPAIWGVHTTFRIDSSG